MFLDNRGAGPVISIAGNGTGALYSPQMRLRGTSLFHTSDFAQTWEPV